MSYPAFAADVPMMTHRDSSAVLLRSVVIGTTAFLTLVDLFATQAILPSLAHAYRVTPAAMGFALGLALRRLTDPSERRPLLWVPPWALAST